VDSRVERKRLLPFKGRKHAGEKTCRTIVKRGRKGLLGREEGGCVSWGPQIPKDLQKVVKEKGTFWHPRRRVLEGRGCTGKKEPKQKRSNAITEGENGRGQERRVIKKGDRDGQNFGEPNNRTSPAASRRDGITQMKEGNHKRTCRRGGNFLEKRG